MDIQQRLKAIARLRGVPVNLVVNTLLDNGLKQLEGIERRKVEREEGLLRLAREQVRISEMSVEHEEVDND